MFGEIELSTYAIEVILDDYLVRGELQPRGEILTYINDRNWDFIAFRNCELLPLAKESRVGAINQDLLVINKKHLCAISILDKSQAESIRLQEGDRSLICYINQFAIQGIAHVHAEAPDEDMLDDMHDYYALSEASIFPIRPVSVSPKQKVPLLIIRRGRIQAYRVQSAAKGK
jgi:hypothetical protein